MTEADAAVLREVAARSWGGARRSEIEDAGCRSDDINHCFMRGWLQYRRGAYGDDSVLRLELSPHGRQALAEYEARKEAIR